MRKMFVLLSILAVLVMVAPLAAQDAVELRIAWYNDGVEGDVLRDLTLS